MISRVGALFVTLLVFAATTAQAQELFTYLAHWKLPRSQFQAWTEYNETHSIPAYEKFVADGTIVHWGIDEPFVHTSEGRTHGAWFAATSLEDIDVAMAAFAALPANPVPGVSEEHHDHLFRSLLHGGKTSSIRNGYVRTITYEVKPGMGEDWLRHAEASLKPAFDELVSDGTVLVWEISRELIHHNDPSLRFVWYVTPDAAGVDRVRAALREQRAEDPASAAALAAASEISGHRDGLGRTHFQHR